jgi:phosphoserine aminotransferase
MNFNAGPAALPLVALERARDELLELASSGMSVMEHSHRGPEYEKVHFETLALIRELGGIPAEYDILLVQGGASQEFAAVPMNFLRAGTSADYVVFGTWSERALAEAEIVARTTGARVRAAATVGGTYSRAPLEAAFDPKAAYAHLTSNETIHGVQYDAHPGAAMPRPAGVPVVCDMSSDLFWKPIDITPFSFVYASAQKNLGPSGLVIVIAKKSFLATGREDIPKILQYRAHAANDSLLNTPPTFSVYLTRNVLDWVKSEGGLAAMETRNRNKARTLYAALDAHSGFYRCPVEKPFRSVMNVVFRLPTEALSKPSSSPRRRSTAWSASRGTAVSAVCVFRSTTPSSRRGSTSFRASSATS